MINYVTLEGGGVTQREYMYCNCMGGMQIMREVICERSLSQYYVLNVMSF